MGYTFFFLRDLVEHKAFCNEILAVFPLQLVIVAVLYLL
jgi:hypothetical protein